MLYICVVTNIYKYNYNKKNLLQIRVDEDLLNQLKELAKSNAISVSGQVRMLVKKAVRDGK